MTTKKVLQKVKIDVPVINFNWKDNFEVKNLLDIISSILAEEYIEIAKKNKEIFKKGGQL